MFRYSLRKPFKWLFLSLGSAVGVAEERHKTVVSYSGLHCAETDCFYEPQTEEELCETIAHCQRNGQRIRAVGTGLSPNGLGLSTDGMVSARRMRQLLAVDLGKSTVTVGAGASVREVVEMIRPFGLTLANMPSIDSQQIGALTQVGAHGTGAMIPPCDEQVIGFTMISPALGKVELSRDDSDPSLFYAARVGVGAFGVLTSVTLQCVASHLLTEEIECTDKRTAADRLQNSRLLADNKHVKLEWFPYTDTVAINVRNTASDEEMSEFKNEKTKESEAKRREVHANCAESMRRLYAELNGVGLDESCHRLDSRGQWRDEILAIDSANVQPSFGNTALIKRLNAAEADYFECVSQTTAKTTGTSDSMLLMDCGGPQLVYEIAIPEYDFDVERGSGNLRSVELIGKLLAEIECRQLAAQSPIEHRFTAASHSWLSPANSSAAAGHCDLFAWIGIVVYVSSAVDSTDELRAQFEEYSALLSALCEEYEGIGHLAKLEISGASDDFRADLSRMFEARFHGHLAEWRRLREHCDPMRILANHFVDFVSP